MNALLAGACFQIFCMYLNILALLTQKGGGIVGIHKLYVDSSFELVLNILNISVISTVIIFLKTPEVTSIMNGASYQINFPIP